MLVYGDAVRTADPRQVIAELRARLGALYGCAQDTCAPERPRSPPDGAGLGDPGARNECGRGGEGEARSDQGGRAVDVERHARLAGLFIAAGELAQGLADAAMVAQGGDGATPQQDAAMDLVMALARALLASWRSLRDGDPAIVAAAAPVLEALDRLERLQSPSEVQLKTAEGYAFYALYPEAYAEAAAQLKGTGEVTVVGVRSIGVGLAAIAASVLGAAPPVTVRPVGHPFHRRTELLPTLREPLRARVGGRFVVVDEGPGLSGSSFGAVADALEAMGATASDIAFLPGHSGDLGPQASAAHRARWRAAERPCVDFDALALQPGPVNLAAWFADLTQGGGSLEDLSGGGWRALRYAREADWPAANTFQERRKFLLTRGRDRWLLKFVGLGDAGERAFAHARALAEADFAPEASALRYGFLAQPWLEAARPLRLAPADRVAFARHLGRYLGWRAALLPAPPGAGATLEGLREMARINAVEALGAGAANAPALDPARWASAPPLRRVWTDNRLHAHEWLELGPERWLKTDAVDHACAHDLVGAQDIAWDAAAAGVEFNLDGGEMAALLQTLHARTEVSAELVMLLGPAYLAFQLGVYAMAAQAHAGWPQEQARLAGAADRYRARLADALS